MQPGAAAPAHLAHVRVVVYQQQVMLLTEVQHTPPESLISNSACGVVGVVEQQAAAACCCSRVHPIEVCEVGLWVQRDVLWLQPSHFDCKGSKDSEAAVAEV